MQPKHKITFQEEGHIYRNEAGIVIPCVSDILNHFGITNFSGIRSDVLDAARNFGTVVHKTLELFDKDDLASCDPAIEPYLEGWKKFSSGLICWDVIEQPLYSKVWGFAGSPDRAVEGNLGGTVCEIKTGCENVANRIQTAFYLILIEENYNIKIKHRQAVYLKPNDYKIEPHKDKSDLSLAKSLIQIYNWKKQKGLI